MKANIATLANLASDHGVNLRPHVKSHKCPEIAKLQVEAGAIGVSCATLGEADAMASAGVEGLLVTSPVIGSIRLARLSTMLAQGFDVAVVVDSPTNVAELALVATTVGRIL